MTKEKISTTTLNGHHIKEKSRSVKIWDFLESIWQIVIFGKIRKVEKFLLPKNILAKVICFISTFVSSSIASNLQKRKKGRTI